MKVSAPVARQLANAAGVPAEYTIQIEDWDLSRIHDLDSKIQQLAQTLPQSSVAYLEYQAYPGFRFQEILRDIVGYHCRDVHDITERREQAMAILGFVGSCGQAPGIRNFAQGEIERLRSSTLEQFDAGFDPELRAFRNFEVSALFAPHGLRCWFEPHHLHEKGHVFVGHGKPEQSQRKEPNALYHEMVYPQFLHAGLHPERLQSMAAVFGLNPSLATACRVLEIGCGQGITLLNCAAGLPSSEFVGIDFSAIQIDEAKSAAERLGLSNVKFLAMDIAEFDASLGNFDYIVAHGMYSWIPTALRRKMLEICQNHLSVNGIAYFSFNTKPGYHLPAMLRDVGLDAVDGEVQGLSDAAHAWEQMKELAVTADVAEHRRDLLKPCIDHFAKSVLSNVVFDELGDINTPFLFDEFAAEAKQHGLRFFAENDIRNWSTKALHPNAQQLLDGLLEDPVRRMQYRDLLYFTRFHASLLCGEDRKPATSPLPGVLENMLFAMRGKPASENPDVRGGTQELFTGPGGVEVNIGDPLLKAALVTLYLGYPVRFSFERLLSEAAELAAVPRDAEKLRRWLQPLWETGFLDVHAHMPAIVLEAGDKPLAHHMARLCAQEMRKVPSLLGAGAELEDETDRQLLLLLDGTRDRQALQRELSLESSELEGRLNNICRLGLMVA